MKKSKPRGGRSVWIDSGNSYLTATEHIAISNSASTTTGSCSGDEEYDSSNSSDFSESHPPTNQSGMEVSPSSKERYINNKIDKKSPDQKITYNSCKAGNGGSSMKTDVIAERWISMATTTFPETLSPLHAHDQYCNNNDRNRDVLTSAWSSDLTYSDDSENSPYSHYRMMMDADDRCDGRETKFTPRYTSDYRNFQYGTQIGNSGHNYAQASEQHHDTGTSTNEHQRLTGMQGEYTPQPSHSSREYDQFNKGESDSSFQQAASSGGGGGESPQRGGTSSGNMSDEYKSSDEDDDNESLSDTEDIEEEEKFRKEATLWKTAVDPKSGRTYYYNTKTLETQWRKPLCCATPSERRAAIKKEKQTLAFFASMEQNILRTMQQQQQQQQQHPRHYSMVEKTSPRQVNDFVEGSAHAQQHRRESEPPTSFGTPFKLIRTISSMEDNVLAALVQRVPSFRHTSSKSNDIGSGAVFTSYSSRKIAPDASVDDDSSDVDQRELSNDGMSRVVSREDSLPFGAIRDATRSQRRMGLDANDGSSFNFSALMRMNSVQNSRLNMFDFIPEGDNEDNSESCSNHYESSEMSSPSRANKSLTRQGGFINLVKSDGFLSSEAMNENENEDEVDDEDVIDDPTNQVSYRDGLRRMTGSLALRIDLPNSSKETITRENSLNLAEIVGERQMKRDPSVALQDAEYWGSYLSETALQGLSVDEGEAMLELASITDRMGGIHSDCSDSPEISVDGSKLSAEHFEASYNTENERSGINSSGDLGSSATPELFADKPLRRESNITSRPSMIRPTSLRNAPTTTVLESVNVKPNTMEKPTILRRNTCGTLYVGSTLSAPDKDATIKCVCAVYRTHILQSTFENEELDDRYKVFDDLSSTEDESKQGTYVLPTLDDVSVFYRDVFSRAQMESDCIIISLIYVERLIKVTDGALRPRTTNWRSILFSCMVMASKVWDDLSMWNADFSHTCPAGVEFQLSRINELEIAVLSSLQYKVKVPASEYAKYYFLLRSMLIKSGLGSDDMKAINPLDVEGAKQLQHISSQYQASVALMSDRQKLALGRSKTTGGSHEIQAQFSVDGSTYSDSSNSSTPLTSPTSEKQQRSKVGLEHMVQL